MELVIVIVIVVEVTVVVVVVVVVGIVVTLIVFRDVRQNLTKRKVKTKSTQKQDLVELLSVTSFSSASRPRE